MALVKFYRGDYAKYAKATMSDGIYFAQDKQLIIMNGIEYGGVNMSQFEGFIKDVDVEGDTLSFKKDVNGAWVDVSIKLLEAADKSIVLGQISKDGVVDGSTIKVNVKDVADEDGLKLGEDGLYVDFAKHDASIEANKDAIEVLNGADTVTGSVAKSIKDAVEALDVDAIGGTGKVITTVSEADGKISATAIDLKAANVAATATEATDDKVAVEGTTVEAQIGSLAESVKATQKAAATYAVKKVETGLAANVKEAYQLVQTIDGKSTDIAVQIPVYKDSALKNVELTDEDGDGKKGQFLKFTYITEEGTEKIVYLDCSKFLVESEFKNGLTVNEAGEVSVLIDSASEDFLSISETGVKLDGVQDAIDTAVSDAKAELIGDAAEEYNTMGKLEDKIQEVDAKASAAHTKVNAKADGHVTVAVEEKKTAEGVSYSEVTVSEDDIASAQDLEDEITRAKAAEDKIEASVGLAEDGSHKATTGNYTKTATTIAGEIAALDAQVKTNADAIDVLNGTDTVVGSVAKSIKDAVEALDVAAVGGTGKYITTVSQTDGKVEAVAADLTATATAFDAIAAADDTVAVTATDVQGAVASLAKSVKVNEVALTWVEV